MNAMQVGEQLRVTADNIDTMVVNQPYSGLLGKGRLNLYRALTETDWPSIRLLNVSPTEEDFYFLKPGDDFEIICEFINYLDTVAGLSIKLSCQNPYIEINDSVFSPNIINSLEIVDNQNDPFLIHVNEGMPIREEIVFKLTYSNGNYSDFEYFTAIVNADFLNIETERVKASLHSSGRLVYLGEYTPFDLGFLYDDVVNVLSCGGLMLGTASNKVSDNVYGSDNPFDKDFGAKEIISFIDQPQIADVEAISIFKDSLNLFNSLDVAVIQHAYAWGQSPDNKFVIIEYSIINQSNSNLYPLYAGFFADWDVDETNQNKANIDASKKLAYVYPAQGGKHFGIKLLNDGAFHHYAIDNDGNGGAINLYDLNHFTTYEKFFSMTNDRAEAGVLATGNDVSHVITAGPLNLIAGDTVNVAFALLAGDYLADIKNSADNAQSIYSNLIQVYEYQQVDNGIDIFPNPFTNVLNIEGNTTEIEYVEFLDNFGRKIPISFIDKNKSLEADCSNLKSGYYFLRIVTANGILMKKLIKK